jgi:hypothetical protein
MLKALTAAAVAAVAAFGIALMQQPALGTVTLPRPVLADGKILFAGSYDLRVTHAIVTPARGETEGAERWIEFVADGVAVGREIATVVPDVEIANVADGAPPKANTTRVELLKGGEFVRIWINRDGLNYLIHLPPAPAADGRRQ